MQSGRAQRHVRSVSVGQPCGVQAGTQSRHSGHELVPHGLQRSVGSHVMSVSQPGSPQGRHVAGFTQAQQPPWIAAIDPESQVGCTAAQIKRPSSQRVSRPPPS